MQDLLDVSGVGLDLSAAGADRREKVVERLGDDRFEPSSPGVADLFGDFAGRAPLGEARERQKIRDLRAILGVEGDEALGVGHGLLDPLGRLVGAHSQLDRVVAGFAHLVPVEAEDHVGFGKQAVRAGKHLAVAGIEAVGDDARLLDVRQLVFAHGDEVRLAEEDVGGLVHGIGEHETGHRPVSRCF